MQFQLLFIIVFKLPENHEISILDRSFKNVEENLAE